MLHTVSSTRRLCNVLRFFSSLCIISHLSKSPLLIIVCNYIISYFSTFVKRREHKVQNFNRRAVFIICIHLPDIQKIIYYFYLGSSVSHRERKAEACGAEISRQKHPVLHQILAQSEFCPQESFQERILLFPYLLF